MEIKKRPIIGIPGWKTDENTFGVPITYLRYAMFFGTPRVLTMEEEVDHNIDLLIIPGGADVDTLRYGQVPHFYTSRPDPVKEYFDTVVMPKYIDAGIPLFGICRGVQTIAVHFGAQLVQNIIEHKTNTTDRSDGVHSLEIMQGQFREEFMGYCSKERYSSNVKVNSLHHQCVSNRNFPECLEILAIYPHKDHPAIEVIRHRTLPVYAVQYHPEELIIDPLGDFILNKLFSMSKNLINETV
jgi:putative glutamine amidotransferase